MCLWLGSALGSVLSSMLCFLLFVFVHLTMESNGHDTFQADLRVPAVGNPTGMCNRTQVALPFVSHSSLPFLVLTSRGLSANESSTELCDATSLTFFHVCGIGTWRSMLQQSGVMQSQRLQRCCCLCSPLPFCHLLNNLFLCLLFIDSLVW